MMDFLRHFITEEIYVIPDKRRPVTSGNHPVEDPGVINLSQKIFHVSVVSDKLTPAEDNLLSAIISAIKLEDSYVQRCSDFTSCLSDKVVLFGEIQDKPALEKYHLKKINNKLVLIADSLSEINDDIEKKKKLWPALKQMFEV